MDPIEQAENQAQAACNILGQKIAGRQAFPPEYCERTAELCERVARLYEAVAIGAADSQYAAQSLFWRNIAKDWRGYHG